MLVSQRNDSIQNSISSRTSENLTLAAEPWKSGMRTSQVIQHWAILSRHRSCRTHRRLVSTNINLPSYSHFCISGCFPVPVAAVQEADFIRICFVKCFSALHDAFALFLSVSAKTLKNAKGRALKVKTKCKYFSMASSAEKSQGTSQTQKKVWLLNTAVWCVCPSS